MIENSYENEKNLEFSYLAIKIRGIDQIPFQIYSFIYFVIQELIFQYTTTPISLAQKLDNAKNNENETNKLLKKLTTYKISLSGLLFSICNTILSLCFILFHGVRYNIQCSTFERNICMVFASYYYVQILNSIFLEQDYTQASWGFIKKDYKKKLRIYIALFLVSIVPIIYNRLCGETIYSIFLVEIIHVFYNFDIVLRFIDESYLSNTLKWLLGDIPFTAQSINELFRIFNGIIFIIVYTISLICVICFIFSNATQFNNTILFRQMFSVMFYFVMKRSFKKLRKLVEIQKTHQLAFQAFIQVFEAITKIMDMFGFK